MKVLHASTGEESNDSPLGRGKGRQALGWVVNYSFVPLGKGDAAPFAAGGLGGTHPGAAVKASQAFTPSNEWILRGAIHAWAGHHRT